MQEEFARKEAYAKKRESGASELKRRLCCVLLLAVVGVFLVSGVALGYQRSIALTASNGWGGGTLYGYQNYYSYSSTQWRNTTMQYLDVVGLKDRAYDKVKVYSQGMRQRLGIGRALLVEPALLLLDEPANGLDPEGIAWLRSLLSSLHAKGTAVLLTSHVLSEVQRTCDTVMVMSGGKIVVRGAMTEVLADFSSLEELYFSLSDHEMAPNVGEASL